MQLLFVCGGRGTRLPGRRDVPKSLVSVAGIPLLARLVDRFLPDGDGAPLFVHAANDPHVPAFVRQRVAGGRLVPQESPDGVGNAILRARPEIRGPVLVVLGDIFLDGSFAPWPPAPALVVWPDAPAAATRANFGVRIDGGEVCALEEKPADAAGLLCGLGVYVLTPDVLDQFADSPVDARGERGITTALGHALARGTRFALCGFSGRYVNVNTPEDLADAERV